MRKALLILAGLLLVACPAFAQSGGWVGLFTDEAHTTFTVSGAGFTPFTLYIYWMPGVNGMRAAEFKISAPANVLLTTVTSNDSISVQLGTLANGISIAFFDCKPGGTWVWSHHVACFLTSDVEGTIEAVPDPTALPPFLGVGSCELGYPLYDVVKFTNICLNSTCGIATEKKTWGAIKELF